MFSFLRLGLLTIALALPTASWAQNEETFTAGDGSYTFRYRQDFTLSHMFADGTGYVTGVTASSMDNGDVSITFLGPRDPGGITEVSGQNQQAIVDEFTKAIAVLSSIRFRSSSMTTMLGEPAVDMVFINTRFKTVAINRYVFTVHDGQAYNFECIYREDKAAQFAPACDLAVSTVSLLDAGTNSFGETEANDSDDATAAGSCTEQELNCRTVEVTELASSLLMTDQSAAMIARVRNAHEAAAAIEARAGSQPSTQDCADVDEIIQTLK